MGVKNYLIEGVSGAGKTTVCDELQRRGYQAVHGDRELAYQGDPQTGEPTYGVRHENHIWNVDKVQALVSDKSEPMTFFCGGSRNFFKFIHLMDEVFILEADSETLQNRLAIRPDDEWGSKPEERALALKLHETKEDLPKNGIVIHSTVPVAEVVDQILRLASQQ